MNVPPPEIGNRVPEDLLNMLIQQQQTQKQQINHNGFGNSSQVNIINTSKNIINTVILFISYISYNLDFIKI